MNSELQYTCRHTPPHISCAPVYSSSRSARVLLPWSTCAMMLKLRMRSTGKSARAGVLASLPGTLACEVGARGAMVWEGNISKVSIGTDCREGAGRRRKRRKRRRYSNDRKWVGAVWSSASLHKPPAVICVCVGEGMRSSEMEREEAMRLNSDLSAICRAVETPQRRSVHR